MGLWCANQLCDADFVDEAAFSRHKSADHAGENEYRKRVLYLMREAGCGPIAGQEKTREGQTKTGREKETDRGRERRCPFL